MLKKVSHKSMGFPFKLKQMNIQFFSSFLKTQILTSTFSISHTLYICKNSLTIVLTTNDLDQLNKKYKIVLLIITTLTFVLPMSELGRKNRALIT